MVWADIDFLHNFNLIVMKPLLPTTKTEERKRLQKQSEHQMAIKSSVTGNDNSVVWIHSIENTTFFPGQ